MKMALLASSLLLLIADQSRIACSDHPVSKSYSQWREISGRQCWYQGHQKLDKSMLYWPTHAVDVRKPTPPAKSIESTRRVEPTATETAAEETTPVRTIAVRRGTAFEWIWRNLVIDQNAQVWMNPTPMREWRIP